LAIQSLSSTTDRSVQVSSQPLLRHQSLGDMKARQAEKIAEIVEALASLGFDSLDAQAKVFGLCRSTMWVIRKHDYKSSGLSARVINCMSSSEQLHARVRVKIIEYVVEKAAGLYGHRRAQRRRFVAQLNAELVQRVHLAKN